jgi:hypothetical protein
MKVVLQWTDIPDQSNKLLLALASPVTLDIGAPSGPMTIFVIFQLSCLSLSLVLLVLAIYLYTDRTENTASNNTSIVASVCIASLFVPLANTTQWTM